GAAEGVEDGGAGREPEGPEQVGNEGGGLLRAVVLSERVRPTVADDGREVLREVGRALPVRPAHEADHLVTAPVGGAEPYPLDRSRRRGRGRRRRAGARRAGASRQ